MASAAAAILAGRAPGAALASLLRQAAPALAAAVAGGCGGACRHSQRAAFSTAQHHPKGELQVRELGAELALGKLPAMLTLQSASELSSRQMGPAELCRLVPPSCSSRF
jgi:hypothetical protein